MFEAIIKRGTLMTVIILIVSVLGVMAALRIPVPPTRSETRGGTPLLSRNLRNSELKYSLCGMWVVDCGLKMK